MLIYFKFLEKFLTSVLLSKDEYNINSKHFNPVRVIVTGILLANLGFTFYLIDELVVIHDLMAKSCPAVLEQIKEEKKKEEAEEKKE